MFAVGCWANCDFNLLRALKLIRLVHLLNMVQLFVCRHRCGRLSVGTARWLGPGCSPPLVVLRNSRGAVPGCPHPCCCVRVSGAGPSRCSPPAFLHPGDRAPRCRSSMRCALRICPAIFCLCCGQNLGIVA